MVMKELEGISQLDKAENIYMEYILHLFLLRKLL